MHGERILLIGGGGFIGRALARRLAGEGREVHVLSRHAETGKREGIEFHRGCQSVAAVVVPLLERCDAVVHLASTTTPGRSAHAPVLDVTENLVPLAGFIAALVATRPKRVLFLSSGGAVYGNPTTLPATEEHPVQPISWHAAGKAAAELFFGAYARQVRGASLAVLRPANVYGPGQPLQTGFGIVRTLLEKAHAGEAVEIWGSGEQVRDFLYIDDLVDACVRLLDRPKLADTFNVGSGNGVSLLSLIAMIEKLSGRTIPVLSRPERSTDVAAIHLDVDKLRDATGWIAKESLASGLHKTWEWLCSDNARLSRRDRRSR